MKNRTVNEIVDSLIAVGLLTESDREDAETIVEAGIVEHARLPQELADAAKRLRVDRRVIARSPYRVGIGPAGAAELSEQAVIDMVGASNLASVKEATASMPFITANGTRFWVAR